MMAHSLDYPTDIDRQPDREERSQEKQRGFMTWQLKQRSKCAYLSTARILDYSNTQYNNIRKLNFKLELSQLFFVQ